MSAKLPGEVGGTGERFPRKPIDTNFVLHYFRDMINVTITMDEEIARWARVEAAKAGMSVSRWVGALLAERRGGEGASLTRQQEGLKRFLDLPARDIGYYGKGPTRDETYSEVLHRHQRAVVREGQDIPFEAEGGTAMVKRPARQKRGGPKRAKPA